MNGGFAVFNSSLVFPARLSSGVGWCCVAPEAKPLVGPKKVNDVKQQHILASKRPKVRNAKLNGGGAILARRM